MASPSPTGPIYLLASVADALVPLPFAPPDAPSPADDEGTAASHPNSNSIQRDAPAPARAPVLDGAAGDAARPVTPTDAIDVAAPFREPPPRATKKRKRNRQSDDEKMDSVFAAAEGVRAVAKLVRGNLNFKFEILQVGRPRLFRGLVL